MNRLHRIALAAAIALAPSAAFAADYSITLTTTPSQVLPQANSGHRIFFRLINAAPAGGASAWCSWSLTTDLAPNVKGSYEITAGGGKEQYTVPGYVPGNAVWCMSATGSVPLTAVAVQ